MTWLSWPWLFEPGESGRPEPEKVESKVPEKEELVRSETAHTCTAAELFMIERAYEHIASRSYCYRCGAPLTRRRQTEEAAPESRSWRLTVATHCRGWRRHRHVATVTEEADDLVLGPFRPDWSAIRPVGGGRRGLSGFGNNEDAE